MPLMRIPYTSPLPAPTIIPSTATTLSGAIEALTNFLAPSSNTVKSEVGTVLVVVAEAFVLHCVSVLKVQTYACLLDILRAQVIA